MKLVALEIDGFGLWNELRLGEFSDQLNVLYGPNEAGKTTLLQFIRGVLYGYSAPGRAGYLPPVHGGRGGGRLLVSDGTARYTIGRYQTGQAGDWEEEAALAAQDGSQRPLNFLRNLLGSVDEAIYSNVFAVGLRELQELSTLSDTAAAEQLYGLASGRDRVSLAAVVSKLHAAQQELLGADPQSGAGSQAGSGLRALVAQRDRLEQQIAEESQQATRYAALAARRDELTQRIADRQAELDALRRTVHHLELALELRPAWQKRAELSARLEQAASQPPVPEGTLAQLDGLATRTERCRARRKQAKQAMRRVQRNLAGTAPSRALQRQAPRLEALLEQQSWAASLEVQVEEAEQAIRELESRLAAERTQLGPGLPSRAASGAAEAGRLFGSLRAAARELRRARTAWREAQERVRASEAEAAAAGQERAAGAAPPGERGLAAALEKAGTLVQLLRRRLQVEERLDQLRGHRQDLQAERRRLLEQELLPGWVLIGLGALFVCGVALALAGLILPTSVVGEAGWTLTVLGLAATGLAAGGKISMERGVRRQQELCQQQLSLLEQELVQAEQEAQSLDQKLPRGGGPLAARLEEAERALASLEDQVAIDSRRRAAEQQVESARRAATEAQTELKTATRRWKEALAAVGLPDGFEPARLSQSARGWRRLRELETDLARQRDEAAARRRELQAFAARVEQTLAEAGLNIPPGTLRARLPALREALEAHQTALARRRTLVRRARSLRRRQQQLGRLLKTLARRRRRLLRACNAATEEELRARAARRAEADAWQAEHDRLAQDMAALLAVQAGEPAATLRQTIETWLSGPDAARLDELWEEHSARLQQLEQEVRLLHESRGQVCEQIARLANDEQLPRLAVALKQAETRLAQTVERYQVLSVARRLLVSIKAEFEARHQPEALRAASRYMQQLTEGAYQRVWTPLDEQVLRIDDAEGRTLNVSQLSRGTREQLYLSLRLALIRLYAQRGVELPLVLDDVLVNFDAQRARAAAALLRDFAHEGHQVFVFTCHEHLFKLFKSLKVSCWELPARGGLARRPARRSPSKGSSASAPAQQVEHLSPAAIAQPPEPLPPTDAPATAAAANLDEVNRALLDAALAELEESPDTGRRRKRNTRPRTIRPAAAPAPPAATDAARGERHPEPAAVSPPHPAGRLRRGPFDDTQWHELIDADPELRWLYGDRPFVRSAPAARDE